jgi:hypothetical protein
VEKIDLVKQLKHLYSPPKNQVTVVDVPAMSFFMVDGQGDPNSALAYREALEALYAASYTLKFMLKQAPDGRDYRVMPLEGLWWTAEDGGFDYAHKDAWNWTAMIMQPEFITAGQAEEAVAKARAKRDLPGLARIRFERFEEGRAAQILYLGPFAEEGPTIARIHAFIAEQGGRLTGKHHEIYLSDPRRTAPEKLKTVIRQPFR